jgi:hypothetical protein
MGFNLGLKELNPICHLLAVLGAHHMLHVTRVRVNRLVKLQSVLIDRICSQIGKFFSFSSDIILKDITVHQTSGWNYQVTRIHC